MIRYNLAKLVAIAIFIFAVFLSSLGCSSEDPIPLSEPPIQSHVEHGRILVKGLAACGFCHGEKISSEAILSGGREIYDKYGTVNAPNITPAKSGISKWSTLDLIKLFRRGVAPSGERITTELHKGMEWMSDNDLLSIASYIKNIPPIENEVDRRAVGFISRNTTGFLESEGGVTGFVPEIEKSYQVEYGEYLVKHVARCGTCHSQPATLFSSEKYLAGGRLIKNSQGEKLAPNITSSEQLGIGSWSEEDIVNYLQTGKGPGNRVSDPDYCPVGFYSNSPKQDLIALAKYLKSVTPLE